MDKKFTKKNVNKFVKDVNKLSKLFKIVYAPDKDKIGGRTYRFEVVFASDKYADGGIVNLTNLYKETIQKLCGEYFDRDVSFNNTWTIFWFYENNT